MGMFSLLETMKRSKIKKIKNIKNKKCQIIRQKKISKVKLDKKYKKCQSIRQRADVL